MPWLAAFLNLELPVTAKNIRLALIALNVVIWIFVIAATVRLNHALHHNDPLGKVQGRYSQLDCANQPNTTPQYVNVDGHSFFLACGVKATVEDQTPIAAPHDDPKLTGWIHVFGCPRSSESDRTNWDTILVFEDGRIAHLHDGKLDDASRAKLRAYIGDVDGVNIVYDCGPQT